MTIDPSTSAHRDNFVLAHLPELTQQPAFHFDLPSLQFPARLNAAVELLDGALVKGWGQRPCMKGEQCDWTYAGLAAQVNRIAQVLVQDMGLVPGNRVLLRAPNNPMLAACWFAVVKAGGVAGASMPLLRAKELKAMVDIAQISHALCDVRLAAELHAVQAHMPSLRHVAVFGARAQADAENAAAAAAWPQLETLCADKTEQFTACDTAADDPCLIGFTSGTTGVPKGTIHLHRDVMAVCQCWPLHCLKARADDVFIGSPPLAFTFGLGGLVLFPMFIGASTVLLEKASPPLLLEGIAHYGATVLFTAPTTYRTLAVKNVELKRTRLRKCVSAGEALSAATRAQWKEATGIELIDGIGATEMLHIFISHDEDNARAGATGKVVPGYRAQIVDDQGQPVPDGTIGRLAVQGPTGCRYLNDARQSHYVQNGWNITGDAYLRDADGYFFYQARTDDMIVSSGYNIAAPEVEEALMLHPAVAECAVIGTPDAERGQIVHAFVVLRSGQVGDATMVRTLQDFVKATVAPYKYPRAISFVAQLPRTQTGKLQRFKLQAGA